MKSSSGCFETIKFLMGVCIKTELFSKLCELDIKAQGNLFTKHKIQLGI